MTTRPSTYQSQDTESTAKKSFLSKKMDTSSEESNDVWDFKLATLFSIFESTSGDVLHRALVDANGDLEQAIPLILSSNSAPSGSSTSTSPTVSSRSNCAGNLSVVDGHPKRKRQKLIQPRLSAFLPTLTPSTLSSSSALTLEEQKSSVTKDSTTSLPSLNDRLRWKDSLDDSTSSSPSSHRPPKPLILYSPDDVAKHCPCTLLFNVLDKDLAVRLLQVMLKESETWNRNRWWLFERMVESPHKTSYYAERKDDMEEVSEWTYNGMKQDQPRRFLSEMDEAKIVVQRIVNELRKTRTIHPYEVQGDWNCNVAVSNHYAHSKESVGWHADKLTYIGPRPTIGSLTLGATRFFRIRKVVPGAKHPDTAGQMISIALPHNSLCIMWPPMQEEWKHEVPPQATITPHPISGTARINITFRMRRDGFSPEETPVCKCGVGMVLRCVFKNQANSGRYFYMCYASGSTEGRTCGAFQWVDMEERLKLRPTSSRTNERDTHEDSGMSVAQSSEGDEKTDGQELDLVEELADLPFAAISESNLQEEE